LGRLRNRNNRVENRLLILLRRHQTLQIFELCERLCALFLHLKSFRLLITGQIVRQGLLNGLVRILFNKQALHTVGAVIRELAVTAAAVLLNVGDLLD
jgi:hypothetical protein